MDKYTLLIILNTPFVVFGIFKAYVSYRSKTTTFIGLLMRITFWLIVFFGLIFAQSIYEYMIQNHLTDSTPLSVADVVLTTGVIFCLSLIIRLYSKIETTEQRVVQLQQKLSIILSEKPKKR